MADLDDQHLDDSRLEQIMRDGLASRAALVPPTTPAEQPAYGHPHRSRNLWLGAAAAVLVVVAGIPIGEHLLAGPPPTPGVTGRLPATSAAAPSGLRYESYAGVQLLVPEGWGLGGSPFREGATGVQRYFCGPYRAAVGPAVSTTPEQPYVGRPVAMSDACRGYQAEVDHPTMDSVWFDSPMLLGTKQWNDGQVAQTVAAGTQRITVFARDEGVRRRVIESIAVARVDRNGCSDDGFRQALPISNDGPFTPTSLTVCVYRVAGPNQTLVYSEVRDAAAAASYLAATAAHPVGSPLTRSCFKPTTGQRVAIAVHGLRGFTNETRWDEVVLVCGAGIRLGTGVPARYAALVPATVAPWATDSTRAYVLGPWTAGLSVAEARALAPFFRGTFG